MKRSWPVVQLGDVLHQRTTSVQVEATEIYHFAGVYSFGRGVFRGQRKYGSEFAYRSLTIVRQGDFVYPKLMAWEGAFGIVPTDCDGCVVSPEFPVFELHLNRVVSKFLGFYFRTPQVWESIAGDSIGTNVRRRRLYPAELLQHKIPLPSLPEQQRIVARIEELAAKIAEACSLRQQAVEEAEDLLRSILVSDDSVELIPVRELVRLRPPDVAVRADQNYQFAGVYSFGRGVFRAQLRSGMDFAYSRLTRLRAGDFVYPKLMAWEGALGVVPPECDGCVVSTEFPVFKVDQTRIFSEVLDTYFRTPSVWPEISGASTGTNVRRRRLNPNDFLAYKMPLPSRKTQECHRAVRVKVDALERLQAETAAELDALLPAVLDKAFKGEL